MHTSIRIINACKDEGLTLEQCAYVLATAYHETNGTFKPVREAYWLDETWRKNNLRYYPWYGRGFVQITWKNNYVKAGEKLGLDLITDPDVVMQEDIAIKILVQGMKGGWFTGKRLYTFVNENSKDYKGARRVVNGTDKDELIAGYARRYEESLLKTNYYGGFLGWIKMILSKRVKAVGI